MQQNYGKCTTKHGVYIRNSTALHPLILCLYVDDLLVTGSNKVEIVEFKKRIMEEFEMTYLRVLSYFHGIKFVATKKGIFIDQKKYATDILKRFNMTNCNSTTTPAETDLKLEKEGSEQLVDAILYKQIVRLLKCLCNSKPDLAYSVDLIRRFMKEPRTPQLLATKRIRRYAKGTLDSGILFPNDKMSVEAEMFGYSDSDWCGDKYDQKSTTWYVFMFGKALISWCSKKQGVVAFVFMLCRIYCYIYGSLSSCMAGNLIRGVKSKKTLNQ